MAPKGQKKPSKLQQVANLQQKAHSLFLESNIEFVVHTLRNRPDLVPSVIEHLKQLGCGTPAGLTADAVAESQRASQMEGSTCAE
eukprot:210204-Amphidinium_carterae.2